MKKLLYVSICTSIYKYIPKNLLCNIYQVSFFQNIHKYNISTTRDISKLKKLVTDEHWWDMIYVCTDISQDALKWNLTSEKMNIVKFNI